MNSSMISKIEKSKRYEREPERIKFQALAVTFNGENDVHQVSLNDGTWHCNCGYFPHSGICSHVMALQGLLDPMLTAEARLGPAPASLPTDDAAQSIAAGVG
ncbi:MAG: hypothetical protein M3Z04_08335 [Chloroflexota bacterium]|nr:hypothetical protein [Chloroflexota bacterium]